VASAESALCRPRSSSASGAQPARDAADLLGAVSRGFAQLVELVAQLVGDYGRESLDLEHHAGERLADFVVKLSGDPAAFGFLEHEGAARTVAAFEFQPLEHFVEHARERCDVGITVDVGARAGEQRVVPPHRLGERVEGAKRRPQQQEADRQQRQEANAEHDHLARGDRHRHRHGRHHQPGEGQA
jgi:hypothetical protein